MMYMALLFPNQVVDWHKLLRPLLLYHQHYHNRRHHLHHNNIIMIILKQMRMLVNVKYIDVVHRK